MTGILDNIVGFFKTRQIIARVNPEIKVSYDRWDYEQDVAIALKKEWEKLKEEIDKNPSCIKVRKLNRYREGMVQEELTAEIEGVMLHLTGPYYPDSEYTPRPPEKPKSTIERGNEAVDELVRNTTIIWAITHCSDYKFSTLLEFLRATRMGAYKGDDCC